MFYNMLHPLICINNNSYGTMNIHAPSWIRAWNLSICLYLNLKLGYLDHSATTIFPRKNLNGIKQASKILICKNLLKSKARRTKFKKNLWWWVGKWHYSFVAHWLLFPREHTSNPGEVKKISLVFELLSHDC